MKRIFCCACVLAITLWTEAQTRYLVRFKDKGTNPFSISTPSQYLSARAIARRTAYNISIDSTDLPVTPRYIDSVRLAGAVTILNVSKWLNQVSIQTTDAAALAKINAFPFVLSASPIAARQTEGSGRSASQSKLKNKKQKQFSGSKTTADFYNYGASYNQVHIHNGEFLHNIGLRGQNMIISMLDAGFFNYTNLKAFDSVNANGQVLGTWDFVNREPGVTEDHSHGMQCFSVIAANIPGQFVGTAPKASFFLFRSEEAATEYPIEEHNWVCAAERADSSGSNVISSSVGYANDMSDPAYDHTYAEMNGNTTIAARGADLAAKKGILVVNSAGNEGDKAWRYIVTPADGDSVLAVGAVNGAGQVVPFSSYGPSSDGQVKPDVASVGLGTVVQGTSNTITTNNGTSFSCPNMAGLVTCLWQGFPEFNNMKIISVLRQSSSNFSTPNDRIGYGIPDMKKAVMILTKEFATAAVSANGCRASLNWISKDVASMKYEIERKLPDETSFIKIAEVSGKGQIFGTRNHQYTDILMNVQGSVSYRIRQIIDTSATGLTGEYIDTVHVAANNSCKSSDNIVLLPNPSNGQFSIIMAGKEQISKLEVSVVDAAGRVVFRTTKTKPGSIFSFDINISHLAAGKYFVALYNNQMLISTKEMLKL